MSSPQADSTVRGVEKDISAAEVCINNDLARYVARMRSSRHGLADRLTVCLFAAVWLGSVTIAALRGDYQQKTPLERRRTAGEEGPVEVRLHLLL